MSIEELQARWAGQEAALAAGLRVNRAVLRRMVTERASRSMRLSAWWAALGALPGLVAVAWLGLFVYKNAGEARFWVPGVLLDVYVIALLVWTGRTVAERLGIDYGQPVGEIQRQIERVRRAEMAQTRFVFYTAALVWIPLVVVLLKGLVGLDSYRMFGSGWMVWNVVFGVAMVPVVHRVVRWVGGRAEAAPGFWRDLLRDAGGYNLRRASAVVAELAELER